MKILLISITLLFIIFEIIKILMFPTYWKISLKRRERKRKYWALTVLEFSYMIFMIILFFTKYWYVGILVLVVSLVTSMQIYDDVIERVKVNKSLRNKFFVDGIVSILFLSIIVIKELLLK